MENLGSSIYSMENLGSSIYSMENLGSSIYSMENLTYYMKLDKILDLLGS
jgi:hypothetical protein